ncbi:1,2-phenylacetyl-CoA epoxidase subunit PaaC [Nakamurella endophytica]|uniref:1,2-phenylacetyl-CoA epoxidase subunit PaaC n=1 Tax=Nakamurella endophytica TaxID=1748367 RepID=UPI0016665E47
MADDLAVYADLVHETDDGRWAFGTGFTDPLAGVDTRVPAGIDGGALAMYCRMLGDDALVHSQRLQEWVTRAPELEEETAIANIALDLLGQARRLLTRSGTADGSGRSEDDLAYWRAPHEFLSVPLADHRDADFAELVARVLLLATWRQAVCLELRHGADPVLAAIAASAATELRYHREHAALWVVRLGRGTELSHRRMQAAVDRLWPLRGELYRDPPVVARLPGVAVPAAAVRDAVEDALSGVLDRAGVDGPPPGPATGAGRDGHHGPDFAEMIDELQSVARAHPGASW